MGQRTLAGASGGTVDSGVAPSGKDEGRLSHACKSEPERQYIPIGLTGRVCVCAGRGGVLRIRPSAATTIFAITGWSSVRASSESVRRCTATDDCGIVGVAPLLESLELRITESPASARLIS